MRIKNRRVLVPVFAIVVGLVRVSGASAQSQSSGSRFEVGGQISALRLAAADATHAGIGGRFSYDLTRWASLEAEGNYFPNDTLSFAGTQPRISDLTVEYRRRRAEAFFGPKLGLRFERFGVFGKIRPGFVHLTDRGTLCRGADCAVVNLIVPTYRTSFAVDLGGVFEFYPSSRFVTRLDLGDTAIRERGTAPLIRTGETSHNFTSRIGFGVRF